MTRKVGFITAAAVLSLFALPATTQAQSAFIWAGAGVTFPIGDYGDLTDTGWLGTAGIGINVGESGAAVFGEAVYGQNSIVDISPGVDEGDAKLYGALGGVMYRVGDPATVGPYGFAGAGLLVIDPTEGDSESEFGYELGVGLDIPLGGNFGVWVEGRYMGSDSVDIFGILAGFGVGLGS